MGKTCGDHRDDESKWRVGLCADACLEGAIRILTASEARSGFLLRRARGLIGECPRAPSPLWSARPLPMTRGGEASPGARTSDGKGTEPLSGRSPRRDVALRLPGTAVRIGGASRTSASEVSRNGRTALEQKGELSGRNSGPLTGAPRTAVSELANWPVQL
jgi:hypothetical protein